MSIGLQEIFALLIVALVLAFALYRRWKRARKPAAGCSGCDRGDAKPKEATLRFYRRRD